MEIRPAGSVAEVAAAEHLFDHPVRTEWAERFLTAAGHHLFLAYEDGERPPSASSAASRRSTPTRAPRCSCTNSVSRSRTGAAASGGR